ncbi:MAG: hypothetical protein RLZZ210_521 [Pseudomonadota bacterium]|jgi:hypothetical protein
MPAVNSITYQSIYAHQASSNQVKTIKPTKTLQAYLGDLSSLSSKPSVGNEQALYQAANSDNLRHMHQAFGKQVFGFIPALIKKLDDLAKDKNKIINTYLGNSSNDTNVTIPAILSKNPFDILYGSDKKTVIPNLVNEIIQDNINPDVLQKKEDVNKAKVIRKTITDGSFSKIIDKLGKEFFDKSDLRQIYMMHKLVISTEFDNLYSMLGKQFMLKAIPEEIQAIKDAISTGKLENLIVKLSQSIIYYSSDDRDYDSDDEPKVKKKAKKVDLSRYDKNFFIKAPAELVVAVTKLSNEEFNKIFDKLENDFFIEAPAELVFAVIKLSNEEFNKIFDKLGKYFFSRKSSIHYNMFARRVYTYFYVSKKHIDCVLLAMQKNMFDKLVKTLGKDFFCQNNSPELVMLAMRLIEEGTFDKILSKAAGKDLFKGNSSEKLELLNNAVKDGSFDILVSKFNSYFIKHAYTKTIKHILNSIKSGTFDKLFETLGEDFFSDYNSKEKIEILSDTVKAGTFDIIIKDFGFITSSHVEAKHISKLSELIAKVLSLEKVQK